MGRGSGASPRAGAGAPSRGAAAHFACITGRVRIRPSGRDTADRGDAEHFARGSARRDQFLSRFPAFTAGAARAADLPRGIVPGDGLRHVNPACGEARGRETGRDDAGRQPHSGTSFLPRKLRAFASRDAGWRAVRARVDWSCGFSDRDVAEGAMSVRVYVPRDSAALSVGAEGVARAIASEAASRGADVQVIRNGSRGMFWLEPLVEVETSSGRIAYGPVSREAVAGLFESGVFLDKPEGKPHALRLGPTEEIPYLKQQERLTFARCGIVDPLSLDDYIAHGGYRALGQALKLEPQAIVDAVQASGLRGRGGAGFPTGIKWNTVLYAEADQKYICCNADEGDSGTYADRMIMEGDPFVLIEGMTIAALAVGATQGYIYSRSEY